VTQDVFIRSCKVAQVADTDIPAHICYKCESVEAARIVAELSGLEDEQGQPDQPRLRRRRANKSTTNGPKHPENSGTGTHPRQSATELDGEEGLGLGECVGLSAPQEPLQQQQQQQQSAAVVNEAGSNVDKCDHSTNVRGEIQREEIQISPEGQVDRRGQKKKGRAQRPRASGAVRQEIPKTTAPQSGQHRPALTITDVKQISDTIRGQQTQPRPRPHQLRASIPQQQLNQHANLMDGRGTADMPLTNLPQQQQFPRLPQQPQQQLLQRPFCQQRCQPPPPPPPFYQQQPGTTRQPGTNNPHQYTPTGPTGLQGGSMMNFSLQQQPQPGMTAGPGIGINHYGNVSPYTSNSTGPVGRGNPAMDQLLQQQLHQQYQQYQQYQQFGIPIQPVTGYHMNQYAPPGSMGLLGGTAPMMNLSQQQPRPRPQPQQPRIPTQPFPNNIYPYDYFPAINMSQQQPFFPPPPLGSHKNSNS
jgi:hypothetical protein